MGASTLLLASGVALLFRFVPNTHVRWAHAWAGAVFVAYFLASQTGVIGASDADPGTTAALDTIARAVDKAGFTLGRSSRMPGLYCSTRGSSVEKIAHTPPS